jgi:hypothetical protein
MNKRFFGLLFACNVAYTTLLYKVYKCIYSTSQKYFWRGETIMTIEVPSFAHFRRCVDSLPKGRNATLIKALYLSASRVNEWCTKGVQLAS